MKTSLNHLIFAASVSLFASLASTPVAWGQNALGSGNALDRNLKQGARYNRPVSNLTSSLRLNNAIVTGNAPGGRSFRGSVGYRAAGEFTGGSAVDRLGVPIPGANPGSDNLFSFQRDSFYSGLPSVGVRGIDALQYQMRLATGSSTGELPVLPIIRRASTPLPDSQLITSPLNYRQPQQLDSYSIAPGSLRSTSEYLSNSMLNPTLMRTEQPTEDNPSANFTIATPLRGIITQSTPTFNTDTLFTNDLTTPSPATGMDDNRSPNQISNYIEPTPASSSYDRVLEDLRQYSQPATPANPFNQLQSNPISSAPGLPGDSNLLLPGDSNLLPPGDTQPASAAPLTLEERLSQLRQSMRAPLPGSDKQTQTTRDQVEKTIEILKGAKPVISTFAPENNAERNFYAEHMHTGQKLLAQGRWFDAEEHFASALTIKPADALAAVGRAHAELGAGLFLSASINLHNLFRDHPSLVSVHYDASLLPSPARLVQISARLSNNMAHTTASGRSSAFLLAYLGFQTNDPAMTKQGFDAIDRITKALEEDPDPFYEIVRRVWMTDPPAGK